MKTDIDIDTIKWFTGRDDDAHDVWGRAEMDLSDFGIGLGSYDAHAKIDSDRFAYRIDGSPGKCRVVIVTMSWDADVGGEGDLVDCSSVVSVEVRRG